MQRIALLNHRQIPTARPPIRTPQQKIQNPKKPSNPTIARETSCPSCLRVFVFNPHPPDHFTTPISFATAENAATACSICPSLCAADTCTRIRAFPSLHHRKTKSNHINPLLQQLPAPSPLATFASPSMIGTIG
jgi:hypothetical protein